MAKTFERLLALPSADDPDADRQFVTALARGLEVLRAFRPEDGPLGNQELAERTGLPKPTISRITHTLTKLGYLDYLPRLSRYSIAPAVLSLGHACVGTAGIRRASLPYMQDLAEQLDAAVALGARDRLQMVYLDVARGSNTMAFTLEAGAYVPIYRTAIGAAFLSAISEKERRILLDASKRSAGAEWKTVSADLARAFGDLRKHGFCVLAGTYSKAMIGAAVPLTGQDGRNYAIAASGPTFQFSSERMYDEVGPRLLALRDAVRTELARAG